MVHARWGIPPEPEPPGPLEAFLRFFRASPDVDEATDDPLVFIAHIPDAEKSRVTVEIDPDVLFARHPKLLNGRLDFLDAATMLRVRLFEVLVYLACPGSVIRLDPAGTGFSASPSREDADGPHIEAPDVPAREPRERSTTAVATYIIDGRRITTYESFFPVIGEAVNGPGGYFGGGYDGLNDCLRGGIGTVDGEIQFVWLNSDVSRAALGHRETVRLRRKWYENVLPINRRHLRAEVIAAEWGRGPTQFDQFVRIFDESGVRLVLE